MQSYLKTNYPDTYEYIHGLSKEERTSTLNFLIKSYNKSGINIVMDEVYEFLGIDQTEVEQKISGLTETEVHEMMDYFESVLANERNTK